MQDFARSALAPVRATTVSTHADSACDRGFHLRRVVAQTPRDHLGGVTRLNVEQIGEVHGETRLGDGQDEAVREAVDVQAVEGANAVAPLVGQRQPVATDDLEARTPRVFGADLESSGEDQAVDAVFCAVHDDAAAVMRSTPLPWVSTRVTLSRLNVCRYSSWKHGRLQK